jgi:hypothetical protein
LLLEPVKSPSPTGRSITDSILCESNTPQSTLNKYLSADWTPNSPAEAPASPSSISQPILRTPQDNVSVSVPELVISRDYATTLEDPQPLIVEEASIPLIQPNLPPPRSFSARRVFARLPNKGRYRPAIHIYRYPTDLPIDVQSSEPPLEPNLEPQPPPGHRGELVRSFGWDTLTTLETLRFDSPHLPPTIRELFSSLSDPNTALLLVNSIRTILGIPRLRLSKKTRVPIIRTLARTRQNILAEVLAGLVLPLAPPTTTMTDDETTTDEEVDKKPKIDVIRLTPGNLEIMRKVLPKMFPEEKAVIKAFVSGEDGGVYGEDRGKVVWQGGVGRIVGAEGGFRGKVGEGGPTHVFVDQ